ncbi:hypothetical protein F2Q68_00031585 [Brassica cretica]|uniref:Uncharacterized protein n=1 Tax=Brassica cretica TaxID=69181 RepID=A0A8S9GE58_BRACR|nr:hypothetical protein F2Q68_00031585 [Brassica cretica]
MNTLDELNARSDTYLGDLVELNQSDTYISELDELSELRDTEAGASLAAGRNGPCSAQGKVHKKCNMGLLLSKFDQPFPQFISSPLSSRIPRGSQQISHGRGLPRVLQRLVKIQLLEHFLVSKQPLIRWTCASYQATFKNPSFGGLVSHIKHQLKSGSIIGPSATHCVTIHPISSPSLRIESISFQSGRVRPLSYDLGPIFNEEEEQLDNPTQDSLFVTRRPLSYDLGPIFDEEAHLETIEQSDPKETKVAAKEELFQISTRTHFDDIFKSKNVRDDLQYLEIWSFHPKEYDSRNGTQRNHHMIDKNTSCFLVRLSLSKHSLFRWTSPSKLLLSVCLVSHIKQRFEIASFWTGASHPATNWFGQKLTCKRKVLVSGCNPGDASLPFPHLWKELSGSNDQLALKISWS